jgi:hypothetical protein
LCQEVCQADYIGWEGIGVCHRACSPDVFPEELPGMPPDQDIKFVIDLVSGSAPIYKRPYRMATKQLAELKDQIKELLEKGYIYPSSSPLGAPVIFVLKKDGT